MLTLLDARTKLAHLVTGGNEAEFNRRLTEVVERYWSRGVFWGSLEHRTLRSVQDPDNDDITILAVADRETILGLQPVTGYVQPVTVWSLFNQFSPLGMGRATNTGCRFVDLGRRPLPLVSSTGAGLAQTPSAGSMRITSATVLNPYDQTYVVVVTDADQSTPHVFEVVSASDGVVTVVIPDDYDTSPFAAGDVPVRYAYTGSATTYLSAPLDAGETYPWEMVIPAGDTALLFHHPGEVAAGSASHYHAYSVPGDPGEDFHALVKTAPPVLSADTDVVSMANIGALKLGIQAVIYEDDNDLERADAFWERGVKTLDDELAEMRAGTTHPVPFAPEGPGYRPTPNLY